jgi:hypothetical protein
MAGEDILVQHNKKIAENIQVTNKVSPVRNQSSLEKNTKASLQSTERALRVGEDNLSQYMVETQQSQPLKKGLYSCTPYSMGSKPRHLQTTINMKNYLDEQITQINVPKKDLDVHTSYTNLDNRILKYRLQNMRTNMQSQQMHRKGKTLFNGSRNQSSYMNQRTRG